MGGCLGRYVEKEIPEGGLYVKNTGKFSNTFGRLWPHPNQSMRAFSGRLKLFWLFSLNR